MYGFLRKLFIIHSKSTTPHFHGGLNKADLLQTG